MKAKDYAKEFGPQLIAAEDDTEKLNKIAFQLILKFVTEFQELVAKRNIRVDAGAVLLVKELNQKWNAMVELLEREYGYSLITRDGFKRYLLSKLHDTPAGVTLETALGDRR